jgi:hypothetical protein
MSIDALRKQREEAIARYHQLNRDFADGLAATHFREQIAAIVVASGELTKAGFAVVLRLYSTIVYENNKAVLQSRLMSVPNQNTTVHVTSTATITRFLSEAESLAAEENKIKANIAFGEYLEFGRKIANAEAAAEEERPLLSFTELLDLVKRDHADQEGYYVAAGPKKREQEDFSGVQVVRMNVDLLIGWLNDDGPAFEKLPIGQQREIWEASAFHFGIVDYSEADAKHWWKLRAKLGPQPVREP